MRDDEIDRLLSGAPLPDPGPAFTRAVMDRVRSEAAIPPPMPFPWLRILPGAAVCAAVLVALVLLAEPSTASLPRIDSRWMRPAVLSSSTLLLSWLTLRVTAIFSGARA